MKLSALLGPITQPQTPTTLAEQARMLVGEGFEGLWSAQAIGRGFMMTDPFVALSIAATVTTAVDIGTAVIQVPLYHPADLAHRVLSLAQICGDRLILGVGAGSTQKDFDTFGRDYSTRFRDFRSAIESLRTFLTTGRSGDIDLSPWPSLLRAPPMFLGSWGRGAERAAKSFDGWIASGAYRSPAEVIAALGRYRQAGGRRAIVSTIQLRHDTDLGQLADVLHQYASAGFDDAVVMFLPGAPKPERIRALVS
jgi:alkanesulfonate monooxygenase SsuD/methylene tetrahydromethanopterin reductase-like flavin-dependent oxidoreductase (luciferase family)